VIVAVGVSNQPPDVEQSEKPMRGYGIAPAPAGPAHGDDDGCGLLEAINNANACADQGHLKCLTSPPGRAAPHGQPPTAEMRTIPREKPPMPKGPHGPQDHERQKRRQEIYGQRKAIWRA